MKNLKLIAVLSLGIMACKPDGAAVIHPEPVAPTPIVWKKPSQFPDPAYDFSKNPLTEEGVALGRFLFYDGILSRTGNIGCGTCHQQPAAFTHHGHDLSHGVDDRLGTRNTPSVQNMAWNTSFFWDGGVHDLDFLPLSPIQNEVEMDETIPNVLKKLRNSPDNTTSQKIDYPKMFKAAFGTNEINSERFLKALSQFMLTLVSATSKYDYYLLGDVSALAPQEKQGLSIFQQKCASCHSGSLFTDFSFRNNGLIPGKINDTGRKDITLNDSDLYKFKVPSLRNVGLTAPYMHDGRYNTLDEVLNHYANDQKSSSSDIISATATLDSLLTSDPAKPGIRLSETEKQAIIAFLKTLSDEQFIRDPRFSDPGVGNTL